MGTTTVIAAKCERCGHVWLPKAVMVSRVKNCSKCKSDLWNVPPNGPIKRRRRLKQADKELEEYRKWVVEAQP